MKIAQVAPLTESVPPRFYGGTERVVSYLSEALVKMGHDVTLFASGDSVTSAKLESVWPHSLRLDTSVHDPMALNMLMMELLYRRAKEFDVIHFHTDYGSLSLFSRQDTPFVTTLHGRLDLPEHQAIYSTFEKVPMISISHAQRSTLPQINWVGTIYHGLPATLYTPQIAEQKYLAFIGRISPEKRVDRAIRIAQQCGIPIKIAAKIDAADREYFEQEIKHLFNLPHVEYIGEISDHKKAEFLSSAYALLFPIDWPEPFGLVMIEAIACGTPVIAYKCGSVSEVVDDGITGFIVEDMVSAVSAVKRACSLSRTLVRQHFDERFTARRMAEDYVAVYKLLAKTRVQEQAKELSIDCNLKLLQSLA